AVAKAAEAAGTIIDSCMRSPYHEHDPIWGRVLGPATPRKVPEIKMFAHMGPDFVIAGLDPAIHSI
ncbi:MAG TPA: hypothetical protein VFD26_10725, partial [Methyloceanibacter sp.]|nr:hypothetical protein [Methyloceanibacter sp.]